jgi:hypothetical protein
MTVKDKTTVYIDVDDEITTVIDKMRGADGRIVALVLPKRAALMQSIVNMKLLKRSADDSKKRIVLITTEAGLLPLAGAAGIHVASTLQSAPSIPVVPGLDNLDDDGTGSVPLTLADDGPEDALDLGEVADKPIGELAGSAASNEPETIELDNDDEAPATAAAAVAAAGKSSKKPKVKKNNKLKVPNFSRFRVLIALGVAALAVLGVFIYLALVVLPKATITISTNSSDVKTNATITLDPKASAISADNSIVPASTQQKQQSTTQQVGSSGSQNNGQTAHGNVTIALNNCNEDQVRVPAGTGLSSNGLTYITQSDVTLSSIKVGGKCNQQQYSNVYSQSVNVNAQKAGSSYNIDNGTKLSVASNGSYNSADVSATANGSVGGGTDNIIKVVAQADIDSAKQKLSTTDTTSIKQGLQQALQQNGFTPIVTTFNGGTPTITQSANVGDTADTVTLTQASTYIMYGVKQSDIKQLIVNTVNGQIDKNKQTIINDGSAAVTYKVANTSPEQVVITATSTTGPHIVVETLKTQVAGLKSAAISELVKQTPGISNVKVKYSPFWVDSAPKKASKITVVFQKQQ